MSDSRGPARRFPGVAWADVQDVLYGARAPALFPAAQAPWGGMSADTAIFAQAASPTRQLAPHAVKCLGTTAEARVEAQNSAHG